MDFSGVDCGIGRGIVILLAATAGMITAQAIDIAALSYAPAPTSAQPETTPAPLWLVQPSVGTLRDSERRLVPTFGVVVSF
jgi:hypothetical protein